MPYYEVGLMAVLIKYLYGDNCRTPTVQFFNRELRYLKYVEKKK